MKVNNNISIFAGMDADQARGGVKAGRQGSRTINGSILNEQFDPIERKRAQAQRRAQKMISDTFAGDKKLDDDLIDRAGRIDRHYKAMSDAYKEIRAIDDRKEELRREYGVDMDSQEQKDLEILEKCSRRNRKNAGDDIYLTEDEFARAKELEAQGYGEKGYTEYQQRALEMDAGKDMPYKQIADAKKGIVEESGTIRAMKLERLKYHEMIDSQKKADAVLEAASDEIVGMLVDEAKEHIDEKNEEELEKAQENKEEKKEEEERLEEAKERREELEALMDPEKAEKKEYRRSDASDAVPADAITDGLLLMDRVKNDMQQQASDMMMNMKLTALEVKGMKVDEKL